MYKNQQKKNIMQDTSFKLIYTIII